MRMLTLKQELAEFRDKYLRVLADFENYKKRTQKEMGNIVKLANERLIKELLPVLDNFERGLKFAGDSVKQDNFYKGVEMIYRQLLDVLAKEGVHQFDSLGERFDPEKHEAVEVRETCDCEDGVIIEEIEKGYMIHDKVLRPAKVIVAKKGGKDG